MTEDDRYTTQWPAIGYSSLAELQASGRLALVVGDRSDALDVIGRLAGLEGAGILSISEAVLREPLARSEADVLDRIGGARFLIDLECLCWRPRWQLDPVRLCRRAARPHGAVAVWPGDVARRIATFSSAGRSDFVSVPASDLLVLRPLATRFPDEAPFSVERIPA